MHVETIVSYGPITEEQFSKALDRLGERDVLKLVRARVFDGNEAVWAAAWLRGERPATSALALARDDDPAAEEASSVPMFRAASRAA